MIKKIAFSAIVLAVLFISCKKDRTCACTLTRVGTSTTTGKVDQTLFGFPVTLADTTFEQPLNEITSYDKKLSSVTKSTAKNNCFSYSQPFNEVTITSVPASSFNLAVVVTKKGDEKYDCELK
jgi:hypothetical protein